ncbi:hypothetical protein DM860_013347 [Cuscuta australis]|uniref:Gibberellin regulated protein n=1 Tax=Cuscuta australis TaxID=267555 RepID=A0A328DNX9_9ASTE|nr:hypothetical protein DM860_013347 [Cuscuta australis]
MISSSSLSSLLVASALVTFVSLMHTAQSSASEPVAAVPVHAAAPPPPHQIDCGAACAGRCKLASRQKICMRACKTCCGRCNCVPPGTSGNKDVCPCYANMTTHGGKPKCP